PWWKYWGVQRLTHAALATMLTRVKYPTLASTCLTESHTVLRLLRRSSGIFSAATIICSLR
ncbi:hypothetical protein QF19_004669, partial [Salmonella enterica subsp. enterica]|nr:hypothetical protein [Salmonella enterica subsp. enterica]